MSSVAFDKIVPFGQDFVLDDMPLTLTLKERVAFFLCLIDVSVDSRKPKIRTTFLCPPNCVTTADGQTVVRKVMER